MSVPTSLIVVEMTGQEFASTDTPLLVEIQSEQDRWHTILKRQFEDLYTGSRNTRLARAIWIENATCWPMRIIATHGQSRQMAEVPFHCRE